ncbi:MAG: DNA damage-inducible protein D [Flavobacteriales bacterium CG_4_10_14_0_2_um_filter_32_8]|nr:MAG: DNA damage-inducible protein D [Flavobacteriales bacterium CG_4_10_14_0_2_um_filter_32_8]PJB15213.1 MAG: DNA damage-inducible protein D [Flavobacteriales bacterium CG_4_9_14_3_um_filter_32_8]
MTTHSTFEQIKRTNEIGQEYWSARELHEVLEYIKWDKFLNVIDKAKQACKNSGQEPSNHFPRMEKLIDLPKGAKRDIGDIHLTRYACYLIIQNADPSKEVVALGQTYFAIQTRKQEVLDENFGKLQSEEEKRLFLRKEMAEHNKQLADAAKNAGVIQPWKYAIFQNHGYMGLYNGLGAKEIHTKKGLKKSESILDHMGSTELAANLFRATQTEEKLKRENIKGKQKANQTHYEVDKKVRQTIKELGGTMPEDLPMAESVKKIENEKKKALKPPHKKK